MIFGFVFFFLNGRIRDRRSGRDDRSGRRSGSDHGHGPYLY